MKYTVTLLCCIVGHLHSAQIEQKTNEAVTASYYLLLEKDPAQIQNLIKAGADVNFEGKFGWTALHYAARMDNLEKARILLKAGAHIDARTQQYDTPLMIAAHNVQIPMVKFLTKELRKDPRANYYQLQEEAIAVAPAKYRNEIRRAIEEAVREYEYQQAQLKLIEEQPQLIPELANIIGEYVGEEIPEKLHVPPATCCAIQ